MQKVTSLLISWLKRWSLPFSMVVGILSFLIFDALPLSIITKNEVVKVVEIIQPTLIFMMLFLSCCKINFNELRLLRWQVIGLLLQAVVFAMVGGCMLLLKDPHWKIIFESAILCVIMPTATAAAVVAGKLGGNISQVLTYTLLSNLLSAIVVPLFVPLLGHHPELDFLTTFTRVLSKVIPLLIVPFIGSVIIQVFFPQILKLLLSIKDLAFFLWCLCLPISIALAMKALFDSSLPLMLIFGIGLASFLVCFFSFGIGRKIGERNGSKIEISQSLGQKNTAFGIWIAYSFLTPVTSIAGGFYAIWHNVYNSYQIAQSMKLKK